MFLARLAFLCLRPSSWDPESESDEPDPDPESDLESDPDPELELPDELPELDPDPELDDPDSESLPDDDLFLGRGILALPRVDDVGGASGLDVGNVPLGALGVPPIVPVEGVLTDCGRAAGGGGIGIFLLGFGVTGPAVDAVVAAGEVPLLDPNEVDGKEGGKGEETMLPGVWKFVAGTPGVVVREIIGVTTSSISSSSSPSSSPSSPSCSPSDAFMASSISISRSSSSSTPIESLRLGEDELGDEPDGLDP